MESQVGRRPKHVHATCFSALYSLGMLGTILSSQGSMLQLATLTFSKAPSLLVQSTRGGLLIRSADTFVVWKNHLKLVNCHSCEGILLF